MMHDLRPDARGLVQSENMPIWTFPPDDIQRLRNVLIDTIPQYSESLINSDGFSSQQRPYDLIIERKKGGYESCS